MLVMGQDTDFSPLKPMYKTRAIHTVISRFIWETKLCLQTERMIQHKLRLQDLKGLVVRSTQNSQSTVVSLQCFCNSRGRRMQVVQATPEQTCSLGPFGLTQLIFFQSVRDITLSKIFSSALKSFLELHTFSTTFGGDFTGLFVGMFFNQVSTLTKLVQVPRPLAALRANHLLARPQNPSLYPSSILILEQYILY